MELMVTVSVATRSTRNAACMEAGMAPGDWWVVTPDAMPQAQTLVGEKISAGAIAQVAEQMALDARPLQLADFTHSYRKQMIAVYTTRLLNQLLN